MSLRPCFRPSALPWRRLYSHHSSSTSRFSPVSIVEDHDTTKIDPDTPIILRKRFADIPAISKWFRPHATLPHARSLNTTYLDPHSSTPVPLELTRFSATSKTVSSFESIFAPLSFLLSYLNNAPDELTRIYLAQCPLEDLPLELRSDLPMPSLVSQIGRGDVYGSSLWAGLPPTMTPLHRDPNPNLFVQLAGRKVVRLMRPNEGREVYSRVREGRGSANMRGVEMMAGEENRRLEEVVWGTGEGAEEVGAKGWEAVLDSGDGLYIPLGWWHSVRGVGDGVNASVNWWFR